jgi:hypothetical protein
MNALRAGGNMNKVLRMLSSFLLTTAIMTATCVHAQETFTVKITGYSAKDFSISPAMSQQLTMQVVTRIQSALHRSPGSEVSISIAGYADKSGTVDGNAYWGEQRAEGIYQFLVTRTPKGTTFGPYSVGSTDLDERATIVAVTISPAVIPVPPKRFEKIPELVAICILMILTVMLLRNKKRSPERQPMQLVPQRTESEVAKIVKAKRDGRIICAPLQRVENGFLTPFPSPNDFRDNITDATKAAKNGIKDPKHRVSDAELEELIASKKIWIEGVAA